MAGTWIEDWEEWEAITECEAKALSLATTVQAQLDRCRKSRRSPSEELQREMLEAGMMLKVASQAREKFIGGLVAGVRIVH
jgi:hypothetical protein